jgi:hypothetical protein
MFEIKWAIDTQYVHIQAFLGKNSEWGVSSTILCLLNLFGLRIKNNQSQSLIRYNRLFWATNTWLKYYDREYCDYV